MVDPPSHRVAKQYGRSSIAETVDRRRQQCILVDVDDEDGAGEFEEAVAPGASIVGQECVKAVSVGLPSMLRGQVC